MFTDLQPLDTIDLADTLCTRIEQVRSVALSLSEQIDRELSIGPRGQRISSELGHLCNQLRDAQQLADLLAERAASSLRI